MDSHLIVDPQNAGDEAAAPEFSRGTKPAGHTDDTPLNSCDMPCLMFIVHAPV